MAPKKNNPKAEKDKTPTRQSKESALSPAAKSSKCKKPAASAAKTKCKKPAGAASSDHDPDAATQQQADDAKWKIPRTFATPKMGDVPEFFALTKARERAAAAKAAKDVTQAKAPIEESKTTPATAPTSASEDAEFAVSTMSADHNKNDDIARDATPAAPKQSSQQVEAASASAEKYTATVTTESPLESDLPDASGAKTDHEHEQLNMHHTSQPAEAMPIHKPDASTQHEMSHTASEDTSAKHAEDLDVPQPQHEMMEYLSTSHDQQQKRLRELTQLMQWPTRMIDKMVQNELCLSKDNEHTDVRVSLVENMKDSLGGMRLSTAFSGIDTPAVALTMVSVALAKELGISQTDRPRFVNVFGVEWFGKSADVLAAAPHGPGCIFNDISNFWTSCMAHKVEGLLAQGRFVEVVKPLLKASNISDIVSRRAYCVKCQKTCEARSFEHLRLLG